VLVKFARESHEVYDRVAIVITGSSETWAMNVHLDAWFNHARTLCAANGIPVFDFSSEVHNCTRDHGFDFKSTSHQGEKQAWGRYQVAVTDYLLRTIPKAPRSFDEIKDVCAGDGSWKPVFTSAPAPRVRLPPANLLAEASNIAVPEPKVEHVSKPEVAKKQAVEKEAPTVKAAAAPGTKGRPPPPSMLHPSANRPPVPDVPPEFKDKVVPKAIVEPKLAASTSSGCSVSSSKGRWTGARKRREVTTEDIKELSDKA
jgi:hypothetical protein